MKQIPVTGLTVITKRFNLRFLFWNSVFGVTFLVFLAPGISAQPVTPSVLPYQPVSTAQSAPPVQSPFLSRSGSILSNNPYAEQNLRILQQSRVMNIPGHVNSIPSQKQELSTLLRDEATERKEWANISYTNSYQQFLALNPDHFSITRAVYLSESAYDPTMPPYEVFESVLQNCAGVVRQILQKEGLSEKNNTAVMYAIQKLYSQSNVYYDPATRNNITLQPLQYDFEDWMGDKDWRKMFVSKLLQTGRGQCHSLPLLFLCIAEQLGAKAWLSLSPNHSFIQYFDGSGRRYNFETTNGNLVTQAWLMQSTYVNTTALKNKTYLDTLSSRQLYTQCLGDLLTGYLKKTEKYDALAAAMNRKILSLDSTNITGLMTLLNLHTFQYWDEEKAAGYPQVKDWGKNPALQAAYERVKYYGQKVEQTGFQQMPEAAYQQWLKSLAFKKERQQNKLEEERLKREIERLKKVKVVIKNNPPR